MLFCVLMYMIACIHGFFIDSNTQSVHGGQITDQHYIALFDEIAQEKHARRQILQFVVQLQKELDATKQEVIALMRQRNDTFKESDISQLEMDNSFLNQTLRRWKSTNTILRKTIENLRQNYMQLRHKTEILKQHQVNSRGKINNDNALLEDKLEMLKNATATFKDKFVAFKNSKLGHDLAIMNSIQNEKSHLRNEMNVIIRNVNDLKRTSNARIQDFMAFIKEIANIKSKTDEVENNQLTTKHTITDITKKTNAIRSDLLVSIKIISNPGIDMKEVGVSVCGVSSDGYHSGSVITYSKSGSSVGVKDTLQLLRSGYFTTENDGLYIISATVMSYSSQAYSYIYKNNDRLSLVYTANKSPESWTYTGTAVVTVPLNHGDKIGVKTGKDMHVYGPGSCLAVIKVK